MEGQNQCSYNKGQKEGGNAMGTENGNANEARVIGGWADFAGRVGQLLWPALKPAVVRGKFNLAKFATSEAVRSAICRGFLEQKTEAGLGLEIGKWSKKDLALLSVWDLRNLYEIFYQQVFGLYVSFPDELMPEAPDEFAWPICILGIISNETAYRGGKSDMPKWKFTDDSLDTILKLDRGRDAWTHSYIVRTYADFEVGKKLKNISANDIEKQKINVLMFRERWILGLFIYWLTGLHLDRGVVITLTGSHHSGGDAVGVRFDDGGVYVGRCAADLCYDELRSREAVS